MINYEQVGARMKARRLYLGLSLNEVGKRMGSTATTVKRWEDGIVGSIKTTRLKEIAQALQTTPEYLLGLDEQVVPVQGVEQIPMMRTVPIVGEIMQGAQILSDSNFTGQANTPAEIKCDFALKVEDDAMINARIFAGDLVFVEQQSDVENGDLAAVLIDKAVIIRRVYKYKGRMELRAENPTYSVINIEGSDLLNVKIVGKPVAFIGIIK